MTLNCLGTSNLYLNLKLKALLIEFQDSFSKDSSDMGLTNLGTSNPYLKLKLKALLIEFQDSFSKVSSDMGLTNFVVHRINTGVSLPIRQHPRRIPLGKC